MVGPKLYRHGNEKNNALKKFRKSNSNADFRDYKIERNHFKSLCKIKKKQHQKKRRKLLTDSSNKPKDFWAAIKSGKNKQTPVSNISNRNWVSYFQSLFSSEDNQADVDQNHPLQNITQNNDADALESQITEAEIWYAIGKLKSDRFGGPDGLCIEMLKAVLDDIMPFLLVLFNNILTVGYFQKAGVKVLYPQYIKVDQLTSLKTTEPLHLLTVYVNSLWKF